MPDGNVTKAPSDAAVLFLLSEGVRQEMGGKLTILGFYPDAQILIPKEMKQLVIPLALTFIVTDGEGTFTTAVSLTTPSGKVVFSPPEEHFSDTVKNPGQPLSILVAAQPFITDETGKFDVTLRLGDASYRRSFRVDFQP
jgi:hypothetical protein